MFSFVTSASADREYFGHSEVLGRWGSLVCGRRRYCKGIYMFEEMELQNMSPLSLGCAHRFRVMMILSPAVNTFLSMFRKGAGSTESICCL
ncbi:hypothetical protein CEXT_369451 [Caerostris extrusa]|uniref:Uncharacterized protein n=1 Tax=Caerostris extrusa TaxID=172846 RepID=A0AAV4SMA9_CAEEX|nr:hypothetical protein CEXT_369451 [Caerostris extrusa]